MKECLLHLSSKSYKEFPAFLTAIYKVVDNFDSHVCAPFICINTQIQKVGCGVPIESTPCHDRVAMVVTKFSRVCHVSTFKNRCLYKQRHIHMWVRIVYHFVDSWNIKGFIILSLIYKNDLSVSSFDLNINIDLT